MGGNTAESVVPGEVATVAGIAERVEDQEHGERKVVAGREPVVDIVSTAVRGDAGDVGEAGELAVDAGVGKVVGDVGAAGSVVAASMIGYHHSRSSRTEQTAQQVDAVVGLAGEGSIASYKHRN